MGKDFLTQMDERVKIARRKAKNPGKTIRLKEQAKEYCIKNIQYHWLNSIPEVLEASGKVFVTATISLGSRGLIYYCFDLPDGNEIKFDNNPLRYISLRLLFAIILFLINPSSNSSDTKSLINTEITIPYITIGKKRTLFIPTVYDIAVFCMRINPIENIIMKKQAISNHFS